MIKNKSVSPVKILHKNKPGLGSIDGGSAWKREAVSDGGIKIMFDVSVNTQVKVFPQELLSGLHVRPLSSFLQSGILKELEHRKTWVRGRWKKEGGH